MLIVFLGGIISFFTRVEDFQWLSENEWVEISKNNSILIKNIEKITYPDRRARKYKTRVQIIIKNQVKSKEADIEVNKPILVENIRIYQSSFEEKEILLVEDIKSNTKYLSKDELLSLNSQE